MREIAPATEADIAFWKAHVTPDSIIDKLIARIEALKAERDALEAQALKDRKRADDAQGDAMLWQYSAAVGDQPPLLVTIWKQRKAAILERDQLRAALATARETALEDRWTGVFKDDGAVIVRWIENGKRRSLTAIVDEVTIFDMDEGKPAYKASTRDELPAASHNLKEKRR